MYNIENTYVNYEEIIAEFTEEKVASRLDQIRLEMECFIREFELENVAYVHELALDHAVMDYFSDIHRLKEYQEIERVNDIKIKAYETFWLLKRKPLQLKVQLDNDKYLFINEKFLLMRTASFLLGDKMNESFLDEESAGAFRNFLDTFYYYLKFRRCDAQAIELMLLAYAAGRLA